MKRSYVALGAFLVVLSSACGGVTGPSPAPASVAVTEAQNGTSVVLARGGTLTVRLSSNPATGYSWVIGTAPSEVLLASGSGLQWPADGVDARPGAPGTAWWTFVAASTGSTSFSLRYIQPWQPQAAADGFVLHVSVR